MKYLMDSRESISIVTACLFSIIGDVFLIFNVDKHGYLVISILLNSYLTFFVFGGLLQGIIDDWKDINCSLLYLSVRASLILLNLVITIILYRYMISYIGFIYSYFASYFIFIILYIFTYYLLNKNFVKK